MAVCMIVLKVGQTGRSRSETRQGGGVHAREGETLLGHGRHCGAVIGKGHVLLRLNVRLKGHQRLTVKGRAPADRPSPGGTGEGIWVLLLDDTRMARPPMGDVIG